MATITAPSTPALPLRLGKGITFGDDTYLDIFGYTIPNNLSSQTSGKPAPWFIRNATTLFDVSSLTADHEVPTVLCTDTITQGTLTIKWYRQRDDRCTFTWTNTVPEGGYSGAAAWIGWISEAMEQQLGQDSEAEIVENGYYRVEVSYGGETHSATFAVIGIPARLLLTNASSEGFNWEIRLGNFFSSESYIRVGVATTQVTNGQSAAPTGIVGYNTTSSGGTSVVTTGSVTGQSLSAPYTIYGFAQAANGLYYQAGEVTIAVVYPTVPSHAPWTSSLIEGGFNLYWGASQSVEEYLLAYKYDYETNWHYAWTTGTTYQLTNRLGGTTHNFMVCAYNESDGSGHYSSWTGMSTGTTAPKTPTIVGVGTDTAIEITVGNMTGSWDYFDYYRYDINGNLLDITSSTQQINTWSNLPSGTTYKFKVKSIRTVGEVNIESVSFSNQISVLTKVRPNNFVWTYAKTSGGAFKLTAAEWNAFTSRINEFRSYKGLTNYTFTTAIVGANFTAAMFNQANSAINAMISTGISSKTAGNYVYAADLNTLVTKLNSI